MAKDIYRHADKSLMVILGDMAKRFQRFSTTLGFDELNVMETRKAVNAMYKAMDALIRREYGKVAREAYREAGGTDDDFDPYEYVNAMLNAYDPLSDFVYTREYTRKRDRLFEAVIATQTGNQEMRKVLKRNLDVLANQVRQYADNITASARLKAFRDSGVRYIRWVTIKDDRVCGKCEPRDEVIYPIDKWPEQPAHWRCRCYGEIATEEEYRAQQAA